MFAAAEVTSVPAVHWIYCSAGYDLNEKKEKLQDMNFNCWRVFLKQIAPHDLKKGKCQFDQTEIVSNVSLFYISFISFISLAHFQNQLIY